MVHDLTADILRLMFPGQWKYRSGGKNGKGPDFVHRQTKYEVELKTTGEFKSHVAKRPNERKSGYDSCGWAQYIIHNDK
ncbi:hypothetical protein [Dactylosporangium sp. NPDC051484]|uniref:hypothetical protein n=1 Tax=Dactylosporangium sp. NPDC051484 TaxID=3154942 RepID=UPI00345069B5